jgi:hypothetical protein
MGILGEAVSMRFTNFEPTVRSRKQLLIPQGFLRMA